MTGDRLCNCCDKASVENIFHTKIAYQAPSSMIPCLLSITFPYWSTMVTTATITTDAMIDFMLSFVKYLHMYVLDSLENKWFFL